MRTMGVTVSDLLQRGEYRPTEPPPQTTWKRGDSFRRRISWLGVDIMDGKTVVDLSTKQLKTTPSYVYKRPMKVQILKLNDNYIQSLPYDVLALTDLEELYLQNNHISFLPAQVCALNNLMVLNLSCNYLRTLPYGLCHLVNLETLDVSFNDMCTLPESMMYLSRITKFNVEGNQLNEFPEVLTKMVSLKSLNVARNGICQLPNTISRLTNLEEFYANNNQLFTLSDEVCLLLSTVKMIKLNDNLRELKITTPSTHRHHRRLSLNIIPFTRRLSKRFRKRSKDDSEKVDLKNNEEKKPLTFSSTKQQFEECEADSVYIFQSFAFGDYNNRRRSRSNGSSENEHLTYLTSDEIVPYKWARSPTRVTVKKDVVRKFTIDT